MVTKYLIEISNQAYSVSVLHGTPSYWFMNIEVIWQNSGFDCSVVL